MGMNIDFVQSSGHSPVSHTSTHILCILSIAVSPANLNNSAGTSSGPALFLLADPFIARSTSDLRGPGSFACSPIILYASSPSFLCVFPHYFICIFPIIPLRVPPLFYMHLLLTVLLPS